MRRLKKYLLMMLLLWGVGFSARNAESRIMERWLEGPLRISAVVVDPQGVKWLGTNRGLCLYDDLSGHYFTMEEGLAGNRIAALEADPEDPGLVFWLASEGGVTAVTGDVNGIAVLRTLGADQGMLDDSVTSVAVDGRSRKFFGSASGITWINGDTMGYLTYGDYNASMVNAPVRQLEVFNDTLYVAQEGGIGRFISGVDGISGASRWTSEYGISPLSGNILSVFVDSRGHQWFGTDQGVQEHVGHKAKENWFLYTTAEGLVDGRVLSIAEDLEGGMWFGTTGGVSRLMEGVWTSYTTDDGLLSDTILDMETDAEGSVWFATAAGLCRFRDGTFSGHYTGIRSTPGPEDVLQVAYDATGHALLVAYRQLRPTEVSARLYALDGRLAGIWTGLPSGPGWQQTTLPLSELNTDIPGGICILELRQGSRSQSRKLLITNKW